MRRELLISLAILLLAVVIRVFGLVASPPSLYWEEVALGYDAYSILKTGEDHHGTSFPLIAFESFGDWKPSFYFYYLVPFIAIFGLNDFAVRAAGVVAGILVVIGVGLLAKHLKLSKNLVWLTAALTPWSILFSRVAWESHLATALVTWALVAGLVGISKKSKILLLVSGLLLVVSMYTYHATRVIAPILYITVILAFYVDVQSLNAKSFLKLIKQEWLSLIVSFGVFVLLSLPLFVGLISQDTELTHRFQSTSIFTDISIIEKSNYFKDLSGNSVVSRILYHRYMLYAQEILKNIFSYFTLEYLAISGDSIRRHNTGFNGIVLYSQLVFLIVGLFNWLRLVNKYKLILILLLMISLLPAALTSPNPHALRTLSALPVVILLSSQGVIVVYRWVREKLSFLFSSGVWAARLAVLLIGAVVLLEFGMFYRYLLIIYPVKTANDWQYGYKQLITALPDNSETYISRSQGRPAMYYWFYKQIDPLIVQQEQHSAKKDQSEFLEFANVHFYTHTSEIRYQPGIIIAVTESERLQVLSDAEKSSSSLTELRTIVSLDQTPVWHIYEVK